MKKILLGIVLSALTATPVFAADSGVYITGALGMTRNDQSLSSQNSYSVLAGYIVNPRISVEAGYTSLAQGAGVSGQLAGINASASKNGYEFAGVFDYPLSWKLSVFARAGFANITETVDYSGLVSGTASAQESGALLGAGVKYRIDPGYGVQAGINSYYLGNNSGSDNPMNLYVAGYIVF